MHNLITQIQPLLETIQHAGGHPLIVGGTVRDLVMGLDPEDFDIEVYGLGVDELIAVIAPLGRVDAVGRSFGVLKMRLDGREIDLALPRRESFAGPRGQLAPPDPTMTPQEAASRRDFTWNAMALTPDGQLLDFFGGERDLQAGVIRHTSQAFGDDPLRVLRAMQFAARFNMRLASETAVVCRSLLPAAGDLAIERVWGEWYKWATRGHYAAAGLRALADSGWITHYPQLEALTGCPQDPRYHPEGDVWTHTMLVCDAAAIIAENAQLDDHARTVVLFAALCHDLGKPATTRHEPDGRITSRGHANIGIPLAQAFLLSIGCLRDIALQVAPLVREHMAHLGAATTLRTARRLAVRLDPATIEQWRRLVAADHSGRPPLPSGDPGLSLLELARQAGAASGKPAPLLQGRDLIEAGVQPGPAMGELLRHAYQAQIDGEFVTIAEGLEWLRHSLSS